MPFRVNVDHEDIAGDPMIIALLNASTVGTILAALRAGVHDTLFPLLQEPLLRALEKRSS